MGVLRRARAFAFAAAAATALAVATACTSPTLPLPPPAAPSIIATSEPDTYRLTSDRGALPNALIVIINRNESLPRNQRVFGTLADDQGSWELVITAKSGDFLDVSQEDGNARSLAATIQIK